MWRTRPVFISSTFQDLQAERDYLRTHVFLELEERLRARRHFLEWVDLRLGVAAGAEAAESARELKVLKVCLNEVKRCRPFLIVLLADRYGWIPPPERMAAAAAEEGFTGSVADRSVTELEIDFGILSDPDQTVRSFFYFREPLPYGDMPGALAALYSDAHATDAEAAERAQNLVRLKQRIEAKLPGRVRRYAVEWDGRRVSGLDAFGRMVLEDVWGELAHETAHALDESEPSWQQVEQDALDDFAEDRARDFAGREATLAGLTGLCFSPASQDAAWGACITGEPGSGKSALFGELYRRLKSTDAVVLAHSAGASTQAAAIDTMLRRFIGQLATALGVAAPITPDAKPETIEAVFSALLWQMAAGKRVVILVDALDQFEATARSRSVRWLPQRWPPNARFVATAVPGEVSIALAERAGLALMSLPALAAAEARAIIVGICSRYHRTLEAAVIDRLLSKTGPQGPAWGNPLWLVLAVEELNLLDADDFDRITRSGSGPFFDRLRAVMFDLIDGLPSDIANIYNVWFDRAVELFGRRLAWAFLGLIAVSRGGWRESDFLALLPMASDEPWDVLRFASLRRLFRGQLRQRGALAQWDFNHLQMRTAVLRHVDGHGDLKITLHRLIAGHLQTRPADDPLRISETMFHLLGSDDWARAARYYGDEALARASLQAATRVLADTLLAAGADSADATTATVCRLLHAPGVDEHVRGNVAHRFIFDLSEAIEHHATIACRAMIAGEAAQTCERSSRRDSSEWLRDRSVAYDKYGDALVPQGKVDQALEAYRTALAGFERLVSADGNNATWQQDLSVNHIKIGDLLGTRGRSDEALAAYRKAAAIHERLVASEAATFQNLYDLAGSRTRIGGALKQRGSLQEALKAYRDTLPALESLITADSTNVMWRHSLSVCHASIADILKQQGKLDEALTYSGYSLDQAERLAASDRSNIDLQIHLSQAYENIGDVAMAQGKLDVASKAYRDSLVICERVAAADRRNGETQRRLSQAYRCVGRLLAVEGHLDQAQKAYRDGLAILQRLALDDSNNHEWQNELSVAFVNIGDMLMQQRNLEEALDVYQKSVDIRKRFSAADPGHSQWHRALALSYQRVGDAFHAQGKHDAARAAYRDALIIAEQLTASDASNREWRYELHVAHDRVGDALMASGRIGEALEAYRASVDIAARLADEDRSNADWQHGLSVSYMNLGEALLARGQLSEARAACAESLAILERLVAAEPGNTEWRHHLAAARGKLATAYQLLGKPGEALAELQKGRAGLAELVAVTPGHAQWQSHLGWFERQIARHKA
jgi:tetratricopeptide (TPR) repeat protein